MSLINQVLNDLEKRGASTRVGEDTVRVVHLRQGHGRLWLLVAAVSVAVLAATAWLKWGDEIQPHQSAIVAVKVPVAIAPPPVAQTLATAATETPTTVAVSAIPAASNVSGTFRTADAIAKPLALVPPAITAVSPNPAISLGLPQALTITGSHFANDATVLLRTPRGKLYSKSSIVMQDALQIVLSANFRDLAGTWSVEVENGSGDRSGQFAFTVQPAPAVAQVQPQTKAEPAQKIAQREKQVEVLSGSGVSKKPTQITPQQQAENEFRKAYELMQQGQITAAISGYETVIKLDAGHVVARQTLIRLLLENKRNAEAERLLQEGLQHDPKQSSFAMMLARIQVGRNELGQALDTMQKSLPYAQQQADYQAFVAGLLQRQNKHQEAIGYYQKAVQLKPQSGIWLMGLAISLRAEQRNAEAHDAFKRALETNMLNAELRDYVTQQMKEN